MGDKLIDYKQVEADIYTRLRCTERFYDCGSVELLEVQMERAQEAIAHMMATLADHLNLPVEGDGTIGDF